MYLVPVRQITRQKQQRAIAEREKRLREDRGEQGRTGENRGEQGRTGEGGDGKGVNLCESDKKSVCNGMHSK